MEYLLMPKRVIKHIKQTGKLLFVPLTIFLSPTLAKATDSEAAFEHAAKRKGSLSHSQESSMDISKESMHTEAPQSMKQVLEDNGYNQAIQWVATLFDKKLNSPELSHIPQQELTQFRKDLESLMLYTCETDNIQNMFKGPYANANIEEIEQIFKRLTDTLMRHKVYSDQYVYELSRENGEKTYLLGSSHVLPFENLRPEAISLVNNVDGFWFESDFSTQHQSQILRSIHNESASRGLTDSPQSSWIGALKPEKAASIHKSTHDYKTIFGLDIRSINPAIFLRMNLDIKKEHSGMDWAILNFAQSENKPLRYLETFDQVMDMDSFFKAISEDVKLPKDQLFEKLSDYINRTTTSKAFEYVINVLYLLDLLSTDEWSQIKTPDLSDLEYRNKLWWNKLDGEIGSDLFYKSNLICVGVAHLGGPTGLLNYFSNRGFKIRRMNSQGQFSSYENDSEERMESAKE